MKKILAVLIFAMSIIVFGECEDDLDSARVQLLTRLNYGVRSGNETMSAYNNMVNNFNLARYKTKSPGCIFNYISHKMLINKIDDMQKTLENQINNNFNGTRQIPYNQNAPYNGYDVDYEVKHPNTEDSTGNTYTTEKRNTNTAFNGTDHAGLVKYMYGIAGMNTSAFNQLELEDFAGMTKYQLRPGVPLRPGDIIVMNYNNDETIDTMGLVYKDRNGQLKMLEMGGNMNQAGSSVKSSIPMTDAKNTAYVVPFETIMSKAYSVDDETDIGELYDIRDNVYSRGKVLNLPASNPNITTYSKPRNQTYLANNGFTAATTTTEAIKNVNPKAVLDQVSGVTKDFSASANKAYTGISRLLLSIMVFLMIIHILWKMLKGGLHGSAEEIIKMILTEIVIKSPYFIFVAMYPILMKNVVMPLFLYKLPTTFFGDFIKISNISMENGKYVTYSDLIMYIMKKGVPLIMGTYGAGIIKQKDSIGGLWGFFKTVWKVIQGWIDNPTEVAANAMQTLGLLFTISRVVTQTVFYRPLTASTGLLTIITLLNVALNIFMSAITFMISTSVGLFYMMFGINDIGKSKALNTLMIIVSGFIQYLINFCVIVVLGMVIELIGKASLGVIITPFNIINTIKVFVCIGIIYEITKQIGVKIAGNL